MTATPRLADIGERRRMKVGGIAIAGRRRRPTGEKAPLPRPLQAAGWMWLLAAVGVIAAWATVFVWPETVRWWYHQDHAIVRGLARLRSGPLDAVMKAIGTLASLWVVRPVRLGTIGALIAFRRWHRLTTAILVMMASGWAMALLQLQLTRERPLGVEIIADWSGSAHPSEPVAALTVTLLVLVMALVPAGRWRRRGGIAAGAIIVIVALARVYLGVDHPSDALFAGVLAAGFTIAAFRVIAPDSAFPAHPLRGRAAHLDIGAERAAAIRTAICDQAGLAAGEIVPHALAGSAGSTPLRISIDDGTTIFGKLYSSGHLRSDRWYKMARSILYGSLEDEVSFNSVSRLVQYEDYQLRLMQDAGVPTARPYGFVEVAPGREYLILTEFLEGATPLLEAEVDDDLAADALDSVRLLWDGHLAHRDIKPSNVMVRQGQVVLVDVAFATARPTAWRQAIDLANMMLILALRMPAARVYELACRQFAPDDIAEAFAATHGVTIPAELRGMLAAEVKAGRLDLVAEFRRLSPDREIIHMQRWGPRRIGLGLSVAGGLAVFAYLAVDSMRRTGIL